MSGRLVGPAQLVSAAILGSAHPGPTSTDHAHRWSLAMSQPDCWQSIFTERLPGMVDPRARQTRRAAGILRLLGHGVGGRPGERLAARLGRLADPVMAWSDPRARIALGRFSWPRVALAHRLRLTIACGLAALAALCGRP